MSETQVQSLVDSIFHFKAPFQTRYISGADRTGWIELGSSQENMRHFDILNDDLLGEIKTGTYYHIADALSSSWLSFVE